MMIKQLFVSLFLLFSYAVASNKFFLTFSDSELNTDSLSVAASESNTPLLIIKVLNIDVLRNLFTSLKNEEVGKYTFWRLIEEDIGQVNSYVIDSNYDQVKSEANKYTLEFQENLDNYEKVSEIIQQNILNLETKSQTLPLLALELTSDNKKVRRDRIIDEIEEILEEYDILDFFDDNESDDKNNEGKTPSEESRIWTEGLLMCLIVSGILLIILIISLSWLSDLSISYGALERPNNMAKKTN